MRTTTKWILGLGILTGVVVILAHGVVVPQFVWQPYLEKVQNQYPEQTISINRVVVGLSHKPHLTVSDVKLDSPNHAESLNIGLASIEFNALASLKAGHPVIEGIKVKGVEANRTLNGQCGTSGLTCLPRSVAGLAGGLWANWPHLPTNPKWAIKELNIQDARWRTESLTGDINFVIDQFDYEADGPVKGGARWKSTGDDDLTSDLAITMNAMSDTGEAQRVKLGNLNATASGSWKSYPWKAELGMDLLGLAVNRLDSGLPQLDFTAQALRSYFSREDDPSLHQAAFSSESVMGTLPGKNIAFNQAEWTFTQEHAKAWTFNMRIDTAEGLIQIEPTAIEGSEGEPAEPQKRLLNCHLQGTEGEMLGLIGTGTYAEAQQEPREDKPFWLWTKGWFATAMTMPTETPDLTLCPVK